MLLNPEFINEWIDKKVITKWNHWVFGIRDWETPSGKLTTKIKDKNKVRLRDNPHETSEWLQLPIYALIWIQKGMANITYPWSSHWLLLWPHDAWLRTFCISNTWAHEEYSFIGQILNPIEVGMHSLNSCTKKEFVMLKKWA